MTLEAHGLNFIDLEREEFAFQTSPSAMSISVVSNEDSDLPSSPEPPSDWQQLFAGVSKPSIPDPRDEQISELQGQVQALDDKVHEERFLFILVGTIVFDVAFLLDAENWAGPIIIGLMELLGLVILAQKCRVDAVLPLIDRLGGAFKGKS